MDRFAALLDLLSAKSLASAPPVEFGPADAMPLCTIAATACMLVLL